MSRNIRAFIAATAIGLGLGLAGAAQAQQFINVLTGGTSGIYYPLGVALAEIYSKQIPEAKSSVQSTKASVENLNLLQAGRGEIALTLGDSLSAAWNGDLKGKRVSVGALRSGTELNARAIFKAAGMSYKDFAKVEYLPFGESVELIRNRQLDATLQSAGLGVASIRDLATSVKIVVVPVPADVPTAAINDFLVSHEGVSDDIDYKMTKGLFENLDRMVSAHSAAKGISLDNAVKGMPLPPHPGAAKYYREKGVLK